MLEENDFIEITELVDGFWEDKSSKIADASDLDNLCRVVGILVDTHPRKDTFRAVFMHLHEKNPDDKVAATILGVINRGRKDEDENLPDASEG